MTQEQHDHRRSQRRATYQLLSALYYPPDEETIPRVETLSEILQELCPEAASHLKRAYTSGLDDLRIDHAKLFVGPFKLLAPPYGSLHLEDKQTVMGASTVDATRRYREAGLVFSDEVKEAPDHIAIELEFAYYLLYREIDALRQDDRSAAAQYRSRRRSFLTRHLGAWVSPFAEAVVQHAATSLYRDLACATQVFVHADLREMGMPEEAPKEPVLRAVNA